MYESYFSLRELPFNQALNTRFFFPSANHKEVLSTLHIAVRTGEGFVKVTGETGTGKTMLCHKFIAQLDDDCTVVYISHPCENPFQLLITLAGELAIPVQDRTNEPQLIALLTKLFLEYLNANKRIILCFDDAQNISRECLETLRLITNFGVKNERRPQVFLFGQPLFDMVLMHPSMQRVQQQIVLRCQLKGLRKREIASYLHHRLEIAGYRGKRIFSQTMNRWIYRHSRGVPQMVNDIAHQSLLFVLREGSSEVLLRHIARSLPKSKDTAYGRFQAVISEIFIPLLQFRAWLYAPFVLLLTGSIWITVGLSSGTIAAIVQPNIGTGVSLEAPSNLTAHPSETVLLAPLNHTYPVLSAISDDYDMTSKIGKPLGYVQQFQSSTPFIPARKPVRQNNLIAKDDNLKYWAEREFKKVAVLVKNGHFTLAKKQCIKILDVYAHHDGARLTLTKLLIKASELSEAESILIEGIQLRLGHAKFAKILSQIQLQRGDIEVAVNTLQYSLPKAIGQADYHAHLGLLLQRQLRHSEAIKHFQTAVNLSPEAVQWLFAMGVSLQHEGFDIEAHQMFMRAQKSQDLDTDVLAFIDRGIEQAHH